MKHILIDADTGIDDSVAILYALKSPNIHVEGIVTCFGNSGAVQSADNSLRLVKISHCGYHVPVVVGSNLSIDGEYEEGQPDIHGRNGIGNVQLPEPDYPALDVDPSDFIIQEAKDLDGEVIIVSTGRMTNLANALMKEPKLPKMVKKLVSMGGSLHVPGNVSEHAEANIYGDARAADMVMRAGFNMLLVGLDVTTKTFMTQEVIDKTRKHVREDCVDSLNYIEQALQFYFDFHRRGEGMLEKSFTHDPLAVLLAEDPTLGIYEMIRASVEYKAEDYKGKILTDFRFHPDYNHEAIAYCIQVNSDKAIRRLFSVFQK